MDELSAAIRERVMQSFNRQPLMQAYGATVSGIGPGFMEISLPPKDFLLRTSGIFHGGVIAALADSAAGYAATTLYQNDTGFLTVEFKINYLNQAKGELLIARGRVLKNGKTLTVAQTDLFSVTGTSTRQVATALVTLIKSS